MSTIRFFRVKASIRIIVLSLLSIFSTISWAEAKIETIQLNHRLAVEILPEVQAFLPKDATARAFNDLIILKAQPDVIADIKQLITKLDTPLQGLKISVLRTNEALSDQRGTQVSGAILVDGNDVDGVVSIRKWSTKNSSDKEQFYQAQGIAGNPILITMGQNVPQQEQYLVLRSDGDLAIQSSTYYLNIDNGFQAVARILPKQQVIVDIHPVFGSLSARTGVIEQSQIITSITGSVGTWIELGQIDNEKNTTQQGSTSYHSHRELQQYIYLKVEPLP